MLAIPLDNSRKNSNSPSDGVSTDDRTKKADELIVDVQGRMVSVQSKLDVYKRINEVEKRIGESPADQQESLRAQINEFKKEFNESKELFVKSISDIKNVIKEINELTPELTSNRAKIEELTTRYSELLKEFKDLSSYEESRSNQTTQEKSSESSKDNSKSVELKNETNNEVKKEIFTKVTFHQKSANGVFTQDQQYLKLSENGSLMVWASSGRSLNGKPEYTWQDSSEFNKKFQSNPAVKKTLCLYQKDDGSFVDASGNTIKSLRNSSGQEISLSSISKDIKIQDGVVTGYKDGFIHDYSLNGNRVVFTKYNQRLNEGISQAVGSTVESDKSLDEVKIPQAIKPNEKPQEELKVEESKASESKSLQDSSNVENKKQETEFASRKVTFSGRTCNGGIITSEKTLRLNSDGKLEILERSNNFPSQNANANSGFSWVSAEENNKQSFKLKFECLYQEADGSFTDSSGKKVTHLSSYNGSVSLSSLSSKIEQLKVGEIGSFSGVRNEYFHNGAHVVLTKRNTEKNNADVSKESDKAVVNEEVVQEKVVDKKDAEDIANAKVDATVADEKSDISSQDSIKEEERELTYKSFRKLDYDETNSNGTTFAKSVYVRINSDNMLQIYQGKDSAGNDVWNNESEQSKFKSVYVHEGKMYNEKGEEIKSLTSGNPRRGGRVSAGYILGNLQFNESGIGALPSNLSREQSIDGRQVVYISGLPPKK